MYIANLQFQQNEDRLKISAEIDGYTLWFKIPKQYQASRTYSPFLAAALLPAMLEGKKLTIGSGGSVSPYLLKNINRLQEIHNAWNPIFKIIPVETELKHESSLNEGVACFFSGGCDSSYTFMKHLTEISHLLFIKGFDFHYDQSQDYLLNSDSISDLSQLAFKLMNSSQPELINIRQQLSSETIQALRLYLETWIPGSNLENLLLNDLNQLIESGHFTKLVGSAKTKLISKAENKLSGANGPNNQQELNRTILETLFPGEIARKKHQNFSQAVKQNEKFAQSFGKKLITVETNLYAFSYRFNLSRNLFQGSMLASIALLLGFPTTFIPASDYYPQLVPFGSHPLTDPLYSSEAVEIIHDGAEVRRVDKLKKIASVKPIFENLHVCFNHPSENCGKCKKCIRTIVPLLLMGIKDTPFKSTPTIKEIKKAMARDPIESSYLKEIYASVEHPADAKLKSAFKAMIKASERREIYKIIDQTFFNGFFKKQRKRLEKKRPRFKRIDTIPAENS